MGILDILFGEGPSVDTQTLDTLTPEQQAELNKLLQQLGSSSGPKFEGDLNVEQSDLSQLSLAGLEERALALSDPNRKSELSTQATQSLLSLLDFESADAGIEDFFRTNVRDPALEEFQRNILPAISRDFGGANFFSSERRETDQSAQGQLIESLSRSRSGLAFNARESDRNRALQALGLVPESENRDINQLLAILGAGETTTGLKERNVGREFDQFIAESGFDRDRISQLLAGINTQAFENVVTTSGGTAGLIPQLLVAAAGGEGILNPFSSTTVSGGGTKIGQGSKVGVAPKTKVSS